MTVTVPYDWLENVSPGIKEKDEIPLFGYPPQFPWDKFNAQLAKNFQLEKLTVSLKELKLRTPEELFSGLGKPLSVLNIAVSPLNGTACWVMTQEDVSKLMALLLTKKSSSDLVIDPNFQSGFYEFLGLEVFNAINKLDFDKSLTFSFVKDAELPKEFSHCLDLLISIDQTNFWGRLILSPELRHAWKEYYTSRKLTATIPQSLAQKIQVVIHLEAGHTSLKLSEWEKTKPGDFILLDHCSLDPEGDKGRILLTLNGNPIFRGKIKDGNIKILENPLYHEVETSMAPPPSKHDEDEDFDLDDFDTESFGEETYEEEGEDEISEIEIEESETPEEETPLPTPPQAEATEQPPQQPTVSIQDIPLTMIIEVGRIQISVQKVMELQPGNMLELDIHPENGVDLVVNGSRIAKGELLKLGETLGVRILDIG